MKMDSLEHITLLQLCEIICPTDHFEPSCSHISPEHAFKQRKFVLRHCSCLKSICISIFTVTRRVHIRLNPLREKSVKSSGSSLPTDDQVWQNPRWFAVFDSYYAKTMNMGWAIDITFNQQEHTHDT